MTKRILRATAHLFRWDTSEFWTGTVNLAAQAILRSLPGELAPAAHHVADAAALLLPYAIGRVVNKIVAPIAPKP